MEGAVGATAVVYLVSWYAAGVLLIDRAPRLAPYTERVKCRIRWAIWLLAAVSACCFLWLIPFS